MLGRISWIVAFETGLLVVTVVGCGGGGGGCGGGDGDGGIVGVLRNTGAEPRYFPWLTCERAL